MPQDIKNNNNKQKKTTWFWVCFSVHTMCSLVHFQQLSFLLFSVQTVFECGSHSWKTGFKDQLFRHYRSVWGTDWTNKHTDKTDRQRGRQTNIFLHNKPYSEYFYSLCSYVSLFFRDMHCINKFFYGFGAHSLFVNISPAKTLWARTHPDSLSSLTHFLVWTDCGFIYLYILHWRIYEYYTLAKTQTI